MTNVNELTEQDIAALQEVVEHKRQDVRAVTLALQKLGFSRYDCGTIGILVDLCTLILDNVRLRRGNFSPEEVHNICHNLEITVPVEEFCKGCALEQKKLYGRAPDAEDAAGWRDYINLLSGMLTAEQGIDLMRSAYNQIGYDLVPLEKKNDSQSDSSLV
jgi:hypothetical protein